MFMPTAVDLELNFFCNLVLRIALNDISRKPLLIRNKMNQRNHFDLSRVKPVLLLPKFRERFASADKIMLYS